MTKTEFTPGPWHIREGHESDAYDHDHIVDADDVPIALVECGEYEADARLIAAAPEMYAVVRGLVARGYEYSDDPLVRKAEELLKRIEGEG